jgi:hypothetical protein
MLIQFLSFAFFFYMLLVTVRALEHNLLLCAFVTHFGSLSLSFSSLLPLLGALFNGACQGFITTL